MQGGVGSVPGWGTKIPYAWWYAPPKKNKTTTVSPGPSFLLLYADLHHSPNSYVEILTPASQNVTVFGDRMLREAIMLKWA